MKSFLYDLNWPVGQLYGEGITTQMLLGLWSKKTYIKGTCAGRGTWTFLFWCKQHHPATLQNIKIKAKAFKNILFYNRSIIHCSRGKLTTQLHAQPRLNAFDRQNYCTGEPREQPALCLSFTLLWHHLLLHFWIAINHPRWQVEHSRLPEAARYRQSFSIRGGNHPLPHPSLDGLSNTRTAAHALLWELPASAE